MDLIATSIDHVRSLMTWFPDQHQCQTWGSPQFRYPFTQKTFLEDLKSGQMAAYSLLAQDQTLCAFGQYYLRTGRCHLARLIVAPRHRGKGLGGRLIVELSRIGCRELGVDACSLLVLPDNTNALRGYEKLAFSASDDLDENCIFMVAKLDNIRSL